MLSFLQQLSRLVLLGLLLARPVNGQVAPLISDLSPRGIQIGGTTLLDIGGAGLNATAQVVLPFPDFTQNLVAVSDDGSHLQVEVVLPEEISASIYQLRVATSRGISSPVAMGVDGLPQRRFEKPFVYCQRCNFVYLGYTIVMFVFLMLFLLYTHALSLSR